MSIVTAAKISEKTTLYYEKYDLPGFPAEIASTQFSIQSVQDILLQPKINERLKQIENEIDIEDLNKNSSVYHGKRHIKNVVLYSMLVGSGEGINEDGFAILLQAAKYHDIGREKAGEGLVPHAALGADMAQAVLPHISNNEMAAIKTVIAFHEVSRGTANEDSVFKTLAGKYGVSDRDSAGIRLIAEILKDADALDRTRFKGSGRTNFRFLATMTARHLIKFASALQEQFALDDLAGLDSATNNDSLLKSPAPQEILFEIKRS